jgi:hypothetical protein
MDRLLVAHRAEDTIMRARGLLHDAHEALDSANLLGEVFVGELLYLRGRMHGSKRPRATPSTATTRVP